MSQSEQIVAALLDFQYTSAVPVYYDPQREIQELYCELSHEQRREFRGWLVRFHLGLAEIDYAERQNAETSTSACVDSAPVSE